MIATPFLYNFDTGSTLTSSSTVEPQRIITIGPTTSTGTYAGLVLNYGIYERDPKYFPKDDTPIHDTLTFGLIEKQAMEITEHPPKRHVPHWAKTILHRRLLFSRSGYKGLKRLKREGRMR